LDVPWRVVAGAVGDVGVKVGALRGAIPGCGCESDTTALGVPCIASADSDAPYKSI